MELELLNYKNDLQMTKYELRIYDEKMVRLQEKLKIKMDQAATLQEMVKNLKIKHFPKALSFFNILLAFVMDFIQATRGKFNQRIRKTR